MIWKNRKEMHRIIKEGHKIEKKVYSRADAIALFKERGEDYKWKLSKAHRTRRLPDLSPRRNFFIDLCRGPHLPSLGKIGAFKLTKLQELTGAATARTKCWPAFTGTAWRSEEELSNYLKQIEEAENAITENRQEMDLFHLQEEAHGLSSGILTALPFTTNLKIISVKNLCRWLCRS